MGINGNVGDYAVGQNFQDVVDALFRDSAGQAVVPASDAALASLDRATLRAADLVADSAGNAPACAVCKDDFVTGDETVLLRCSHRYHEECIVPWFRRAATCPVCRVLLEPAPE